MNETKERLNYIDMVKGFSILCIILGHLLPGHYYIQSIITVFHVPIFYIISGFLIRWKEEKTGKIELKTVIKNSIRGLAIPYFFFSFIMIAIQTVQIKDLNYTKFMLQYMFSLKGIAALWFIPSLFFAKIGFTMIGKIKHKWVQYSILLITSLCFIPMGLLENNGVLLVIRRISFAMLFLTIGYDTYHFIKEYKIPNILLICIILLVMLININVGPFSVYNIESSRLVLSIFLAVIGCISMIMLFRNLPQMKLLASCGKNSIVLLGTHQMIIALLSSCLGEVINKKGVIVIIPILAIAEIVCTFLINRYMPFMIRKTFKKRKTKKSCTILIYNSIYYKDRRKFVLTFLGKRSYGICLFLTYLNTFHNQSLVY